MRLKIRTIGVALVVLLLAIGTLAAACTGAKGPQGPKGDTGPQGPAGEAAQTTITTNHGELTLDQLAEIQPGLGTVMIEYGKRFYNIGQAVNAANWDFAGYQLKEALEIQEVGEATRPEKAPMLKAFEDSYMTPLSDAIKAKDLTAFQDAYGKAQDGCNACHTATGHSYISYPNAIPEVTITTHHGELTLEQLAEIQPGLGTIMMEYGKRYYILYYAAKAGNWDLAEYELHEQLEIQEVGEATRPGKAPMLKAFEDSYLTPLGNAIDAKDWSAFETAYNNGVQGCNACHAGTGHPYITYSLPTTPPDMPKTVASP